MEALLTHSCGSFSPWLNSMISSRWPSVKSVSHQKTFMIAIVKLNWMISSRWPSAKSASNKKAFRTPPFWCCITHNCNLHVWVLQHKMANPIITANPITTARLWWHEEDLSQHLIQFFLVSFPVALRSHCAFNWRWGYDFKEIISSPHLNAHGGIKKYRIFSLPRLLEMHLCTTPSAKMHQPRHTAMLCNPSRLTCIIQISHAWISLAKLSNNSAHAGRAKRDPSGHTSMGRLVLHHLRLLFGSHFCPRTHAPASVSAACEASF